MIHNVYFVGLLAYPLVRAPFTILLKGIMSNISSVTHKATGTFLQLFPLLARDSTLTIPNKLTLYKLFIRSVLTYAAPVWSDTSPSNYRSLQVLQSKCLRNRQLP
jgi:hypothetical protein